MQGKKTHEQQVRILERKPDVPDARQMEEALKHAGKGDRKADVPDRSARQSEFPVSRGGMNQEDRNHNKHNHGGQSGHKPQKHSPAEEGH
jgi:hypothetical protein